MKQLYKCETRTKRKFVVKIEEDSNDGCVCYVIKCYLNNIEVRKSETYDGIDNCLIDFYKFERSIYDDYKIDTRFDELFIKIDIKLL